MSSSQLPVQPDSASINRTQNEERNLRRQLAARMTYRKGTLFHFGGSVGALVLALLSPLMLFEFPDAGPTLGAIAGVWVFASRLVLEPLRLRQQAKGARIQEMFDVEVLGLDWNASLVERVSEEEVRKASKKLDTAEGIADWYPMKSDIAWPGSVLVCQRSNAVWARRQHEGFGVVLIIAALVWGLVGVLIAIIDRATLAEYLTTIALPSLPAMLDAADMAKGHLRAAAARRLLEFRTDGLIGSQQLATTGDLREIQDQLFGLRADAPVVPNWFYKLVKPQYETDMLYAAEHLAGHGDGN